MKRFSFPFLFVVLFSGGLAQQSCAQGVLQFKSGFEPNTYWTGSGFGGIDYSAPSGINNWSNLTSYLDWLRTGMYYGQGGDFSLVSDPVNPGNTVLRLRTLTASGSLSRSQWAMWQTSGWDHKGGVNRYEQQFFRQRMFIPIEVGDMYSTSESAAWFMIWESHAWPENVVDGVRYGENTRHGIYIDKASGEDFWHFQVVQERPEGYRNLEWENVDHQDVAVPFGEWFTFEVFFKYHETAGEFFVAIATEDRGRQVVAEYKGQTKYDRILFDVEPFKQYHDVEYIHRLGSVSLYYDDFEIWNDYPLGYPDSGPTQTRHRDDAP
jgi:hypothetical protein